MFSAAVKRQTLAIPLAGNTTMVKVEDQLP